MVGLPWAARTRHSDLSFEQLEEYYNGDQPLSFLPEVVRAQAEREVRPLVLNYPALVVDSVKERLYVEGFLTPGGRQANAELWAIWQASNLDAASSRAHLDALIFGRSFILVWPDADRPDIPRVTVESAAQMEVEYDPATGRVTRAIKSWGTSTIAYRTTYDRLFITREQMDLSVPVADRTWQYRTEPVPNILGRVPVVPLVNRGRTNRPQGESEMTRVLSATDAIIELATDMMVTSHHHADPRRWAANVDLGGSDAEAERTAAKVERDWTGAPRGKVWLADGAGDRPVQFGQFAAAGLENFVRAMAHLKADVAALSGLPPHYFGIVGENPASADALRASESTLVRRVEDKQRMYGEAWEEVMRLCLLVRDGAYPDDAMSMTTIWRSAETPTIAQKADAAVKLTQGDRPVITVRQAREDLGYTPIQQQRMDSEGDEEPDEDPPAVPA